jgi:catechol 2,3-dioxygenase
MTPEKSIDPGVRIGHVHLKVANLERALHFYRDVLGFDLTQRMGDSAAFISAGGYHHHIGLNTWESKGASPPPARSTGLYHLAILYPTRRSLADALKRLVDAGIPLEGASDHGVSESLYLRDPDKNGVELYWDKPESDWPRTPSGGLSMFTEPLDLQNLLDALN